ncbi:MAG: porphobilinogen synthase [Magnetococcales bacterium]|nr:porphobilinogen synthase [Magnetococcales bacterium]
MKRPNLIKRPRRLRRSEALRTMVRETHLHPEQLILPLFIVPGKKIRTEVISMPGVFQLSIDQAIKEAGRALELGVGGVILFGIPKAKDAVGSDACDHGGIVQTAIRALRKAHPTLLIIADACFCEYTDHGHCGILTSDHDVDNDATLKILGRSCITYADAGVDIVAPSGMMDGMVSAIRRALDKAGHTTIPILSYAAKYASAYYGPFRDAAESSPSFGDRRTYQMDPANRLEALREVALDVDEGADMLMVKPGLAYLDIIRDVRERFDLPLAAYHVSGEYSMIKAAAERGWIDEERIVMETLTAFRRAGADMILTYHALYAAERLRR